MKKLSSSESRSVVGGIPFALLATAAIGYGGLAVKVGAIGAFGYYVGQRMRVYFSAN